MAIATFSVPIFFICSGYFSYSKILQKGYIHRRIKNLLKHFCFGFFLSFMWDILGRNFHSFNFSRESVFSFLLFNATEFFTRSFALWFISALIYCYILCSIKYLNRLSWKNKLVISILLITALLILETLYIGSSSGIKFYHYRNFLFVGMPCFLIGEIIAEKKERVLRHRNLYCAGIIIGLMSVIIERLTVGCFIEYYIGSFIVSIAMFMLCISTEETSFIHARGIISGELSTYIYLFHVFVSGAIKKIFKNTTFRGIAFSFFVFLTTMIVSLLYIKIKSTIKVWCPH